jgi:hypothetical protein
MLMLSAEDLAQAASAYKSGSASLDQFADWFRVVSRRKFSESPEVLHAIQEIDAAFSRLDFEGIDETEFREELDNAIRPFASSVTAINVLCGDPQHWRNALRVAAAFALFAMTANYQSSPVASSMIRDTLATSPAVLLGHASV